MKQINVGLFILTVGLGIVIGCPLPGAEAEDRCKEWVAKIVSVQGMVQVKKAGTDQWGPVQLNDTFCPNDMIRILEKSRAEFILRGGGPLRLDQNSTTTFAEWEEEQSLWIKLIKGAAYFFSRVPRRLKLTTPFVNGVVEGTEFFARVDNNQTFLHVFEGSVLASNEMGNVPLASGQSAVAPAKRAPELRVLDRPREAVQWALYYPPVIDFTIKDFPGGAETGWQAVVRESIGFYWDGNLSRALSCLKRVPRDIRDPRFFTYRAALLLTVGRVEETNADIERALHLDPRNSRAFALQAIIAVTQNRKNKALELAHRAVEMDSGSPAAMVALSYAQQADFNLREALNSVKEAVRLGPENALAWARLAELWLSFGDLDKALEAARKAVILNPRLARTQTVLGFACLSQIRTGDAAEAFEKAIELDQADPLPRLGLGLVEIPEGKLKAGRVDMEIATGLDPNNSLIRSYLGKSYYEEKRDMHAFSQFAIAKELDPLDPTPWFYEAISKQTLNRPVEALQELQKSIELNDYRAVYRSRLLLDQDIAARSAGLARIYNDLGFQQLALLEGWKSLNRDPTSYSAHRFLADSYAALPRHEIARVSELLQSQLLQPINITPIQPRLAETNLFILRGAWPTDASFNEFNPLFQRDCFTLQANGITGGNDTLGDELVHSGVQGRLSYSVGQFHYETDGFRNNNDQEQDIYNAFVQASLSYKTSIQAEWRDREIEKGDLGLRFDPDDFFDRLRERQSTGSIRFGFHHAFSPHSDMIGSLIHSSDETTINNMLPSASLTLNPDDDSYCFELQHLYRAERFRIISGAGHFDIDRRDTTSMTATVSLPVPPFTITTSQKITEERDIRHTNLYLYSLLEFSNNLTFSIGGSADFFQGGIVDKDRFNPKLGVTWNPCSSTTLRGSVFRTFKRTLITNQTLEPTQVAGFNQFFDDGEGTESWRYGIAVDHKFTQDIYGGVEYARRDLNVPYEFIPAPPAPQTLEVREADWEENLFRVYLYQTLHPWLALNGGYQYERFDRDRDFPAGIEHVTTHRFSFGIAFYHPSGFRSQVKATFIDQKGRFLPQSSATITPGEDHFLLVDASMGYRLRERSGFISFEVKNLFNKFFKFYDTDPVNPLMQPDRLFLLRLTLAF